MPDGTELDGYIEGDKFIVTASGIGDSLAEVGQQLAWLGAALRTSPFPTGVAQSAPRIRQIGPLNRAGISGIGNQQNAASESGVSHVLCVIGFDITQPTTTTPSTVQGQCWHNMFRNPVLVTGYPIPAKGEHSLGLEMPLNMMANMAGSTQVVKFNNNLIFKGFSTMLVATKMTRDFIIWHYIFNPQGERISYMDHSLDADKVTLADMNNLPRHVVGWCDDCHYCAGAPDARYNVHGTGLPPPHSGCILEKISISAGKFVSAGATFAVGIKDTPMHLHRNGYIPNLKWMRTKYVLLWETAAKRGWLVNGTSALLHLVRASLHHYSQDDFSTAFLFDQAEMNDQADRRPNSAAKVLINDKNRRLKIYPGKVDRFDQSKVEDSKLKGVDTKETSTSKSSYYLFEDLVEQHRAILEQIMEHQQRVGGRDGVNVKLRVRKHLEGWDFSELVTGYDPIPRVATLQALGYGWVDFVRSIGAVTLFGRDFGDIIKPVEFKGMCLHWTSLPAEQYYLATEISDLKNIMEKFGNMWDRPIRPVHDLAWHCPGESQNVVAECHCQSQDAGSTQKASHLTPPHARDWKLHRHHHNPVQVFCPKRTKLILPVESPERLPNTGAVVFGHNVSWGFWWRDSGDEPLEQGTVSTVQQQSSLSPSTTASDPPPGKEPRKHTSHWLGRIIPNLVSPSDSTSTRSTGSSSSKTPTSFPTSSMTSISTREGLGSYFTKRPGMTEASIATTLLSDEGAHGENSSQHPSPQGSEVGEIESTNPKYEPRWQPPYGETVPGPGHSLQPEKDRIPSQVPSDQRARMLRRERRKLQEKK